MNRWHILLLLFLAAGGLLPVVRAQEGDSCPVFVTAALQSVQTACANVGRNQACYGNNAVIAEFWQERDDLLFSAPNDRVALVDLRRVSTAPLDLDKRLWGVVVLKAQANLPMTLPGQAVTFLLMGDATLENAVEPDAALLPVTPVQAVVASNANLRSLPSTTSNIVGSTSAGETLALIGLDPAAGWYEIEQIDGTHAWVRGDLVTVAQPDLLAGLPIVDASAPRFAPMQAFYFNSQSGDLACSQAPNALVIQSPENFSVLLNINGLEIRIGSTVLFTSFVQPDGTRLLVGTLLEGTLDARYQAFALDLTQPGQTFAVTLNAEGQVDENSQLVDLGVNATVAANIQAGCGSVAANPLLPAPLPPNVCDFAVSYQTTSKTGGSGDLSDVGPGDPCTLAADRLANLRGGPGVSYPWNGQLLEGERAVPDGYALDEANQRWWRLSNGLWVRSDLVEQAGACDSLPLITIVPEPPPPPPPTGSQIYEITHSCADLNNVRAGQTIVFQRGIGRWPTPEEKAAAMAGVTATITIDGTPLEVYYEGTTLHTGDGAPDGYGDRARANWTATPGTHTVSVFWSVYARSDSCTFTIRG
jgi:uncharacterized protein YraI